MNTNVQPDAILAAILGSAPCSRVEVVKKLWDYIKANRLQSNKMILADAKLKLLFGGRDQVDMFAINKYITAHITPTDIPSPPPPPARPILRGQSDSAKAKELKELLYAMKETYVSVELFFDGNEDPGSIGCNLTNHPGISLFRTIFLGLTKRPDVEAAYALVDEIDPGEGSWPFTDGILVAGRISIEELKLIVKPLQPNEVRSASKLPPSIRAKHDCDVLLLWWD